MLCNCNNKIQVVVPSTITVTADATTITLPATFIPVNGSIYDIPLATAIPDGTNGNVITITNSTINGNLLNRLGSNVRMGTLNTQWVLRVMYLEDPEHWNLISRRLRNVT